MARASRFAPTFSVLVAGRHGLFQHEPDVQPDVFAQYCNGSRTPPEFASGGYQVPAGVPWRKTRPCHSST